MPSGGSSMEQGIWSKLVGKQSSAGQSAAGEEGSGDSLKNKNNENYRFAVYMPTSHEDAMRSAETMKNGSGVVINGERLDSAGYQRVLDFLDGAAYVLGGKSRRVSDTVQVYVPASMEIEDDTPSYYGNLSTGKKRTDV